MSARSRYRPPVAGTLRSEGCEWRVRVLPWSLARRLDAIARGGLSPDDQAARTDELLVAVWERCVEALPGPDADPPPAADDVPLALLEQALALAAGLPDGAVPRRPHAPEAEPAPDPTAPAAPPPSPTAPAGSGSASAPTPPPR